MMGGGNSNEQSQQPQQGQSSGGGFLGGIGDKLNGAAGGGRESEKNEDYLDKGRLFSLFQTSTLLTCCQVSILCKRSSWVKDHRTTSLLLSRPRTSRLATLSVAVSCDDSLLWNSADGVLEYKSASGNDFPIEDKKRFGE